MSVSLVLPPSLKLRRTAVAQRAETRLVDGLRTSGVAIQL